MPETPNHPHTPNRFAVIPTPDRVGADKKRTGAGVTIAFLDSGFAPHPDLTQPRNRVLEFIDVNRPDSKLNGSRAPEAWDWHGTQTSVVAAGNGNLSGGVYRGIACDAEVVLVKVGEKGRIKEEDIARGLRWVIDNMDRYNIRVASLSLGGDEDISYHQSAADQLAEEAVQRGLTLVVAAGNSGCTERHRPIPPANSPSVITVGGYDDKNELLNPRPALYCSSYGPTTDGLLKPEILGPAIWIAAPILPGTPFYDEAAALAEVLAAPDYELSYRVRALWQRARLEESLCEASPGAIRSVVESLLSRKKIVASHYQHVDGTSFAAPIVASVVAQMLEANPVLTPESIKNLLISTADRIPGAPVMRQGFGIINAHRAVREAACEQHVITGQVQPPRIEQGRLVFEFHDDRATTVSIAGDFNGWEGGQYFLSRTAQGIWRIEIDAPPAGLYRYKFVVDSNRWVEDPVNGLQEPDGFGGLNSLLNLRSITTN
jgi:serine protease AprX